MKYYNCFVYSNESIDALYFVYGYTCEAEVIPVKIRMLDFIVNF